MILSLNAGILETATDKTSAEDVRTALHLMEDEFRKANSGMSLQIIVDQPSDAVFVMERMSRRYRIGPPPRSVLEDLYAETESRQPEASDEGRLRITEFLSGLQESNPYYIKHQDGIVFLASGLQLYSGGQVHYDLIVLSQPLIDDRPEAWTCCSLQGNIKDYVLLPAPGRSALDGVAVATANNTDQIRMALQRLIGTDSQWKLSPSRRNLFRLYAARNGELSRDECVHLSSARMSLQEMQGVQLIAVQESISEIERFCADR